MKEKTTQIIVISIILILIVVLMLRQKDFAKYPHREVCCKSYGLGANMNQVNIQYEMLPANECEVPEGFVGGGKDIVKDSYCID